MYVCRTATKHEIKEAYRKLAMALHPDRHDGCEEKSKEFQRASEAYAILSNHETRRSYDGHRTTKKNYNYRKVYSPKAPPGFKIFNAQKHYDMHYGDGIMKEEINRARKRAEAASTRSNPGYDYTSPLGKGFTFAGSSGKNFYTNPYSKQSPQGPRNNHYTNDILYEEVHIFGTNEMYDSTTTKRQAKETIKSRMEARRQTRIRNRGDPTMHETSKQNESSCIIM